MGILIRTAPGGQPTAQTPFPADSTQWVDTDNDGYGDNPPPATTGDGCPTVNGNSVHDRFGCTDTDGDGYSDPDSGWTVGANGADAFVSDATQWSDIDMDGYGDNANGNNPDARARHSMVRRPKRVDWDALIPTAMDTPTLTTPSPTR